MKANFNAAGVDYRDRISVACWVVVFGLGISLLVQIPTTQLTFRALGSPITLSLSVMPCWAAAGATAPAGAAAGAGAHGCLSWGESNKEAKS